MEICNNSKTVVEYGELMLGSIKPIGGKTFGAVWQKASEHQLVGKTIFENGELVLGSIKPIGGKTFGAVSQKASEHQLVDRTIALGGLLKDLILSHKLICYAVAAIALTFVSKENRERCEEACKALGNILLNLKDLIKNVFTATLRLLGLITSPISATFCGLRSYAVGAKKSAEKQSNSETETPQEVSVESKNSVDTENTAEKPMEQQSNSEAETSQVVSVKSENDVDTKNTTKAKSKATKNNNSPICWKGVVSLLIIGTTAFSFYYVL
ncbi:MAG: hypothetical protein LBT64_03105 [Puniceicoccales bacterium]|jgi:hypothetical protein|nr:hypothetical protein [Puniceicoccales bacterium]